MNYKEALRYIENIERSGSDYGIERMRVLLDLLGSPDKDLKIVHIAGTNGKGSVSAYLTSVFVAAGYKCGTYNSPSVFSYNERFLIDGAPLCDSDVAKYMSRVRSAVENRQNELKSRNVQNIKTIERRVNGEEQEIYGRDGFNPTAFEIETACALCAFLENGCRVCVLETGLGGRWDATNAVCRKELAVITAIGLDHCALLGGTLAEIAGEKAAIINGDAVTFRQADEIMRRLERPFAYNKDGSKNYRECRLNVASAPVPLGGSSDGQSFLYDGKPYKISMLGAHQLTNASLAICAVKLLRSKGWEISEKALSDGLEKASIKARFEIINSGNDRFSLSIPKNKTVVLDGAHNPQGALSLADSVKQYFYGKKVNLVFGMLADKDYASVSQTLAPLAVSVYCVTPRSPRALTNARLAEAAALYCGNVFCASGVREAVKQSLETDAEITVICGSLTLFKEL